MADCPVEILSFDWYDSDDRSYGDFKIAVKTPTGILRGSGLVHCGDTEDCKWTFDGKDIPVGPDVVDDDDVLEQNLVSWYQAWTK